ncbi:hypothetical protein [Paenibacillus glucanolyticus]|nr:hypothetical protein [Paenibacillus glucanolyticus]
MSTIQMLGSIQEGEVARLVSEHIKITVIRKGGGFFYKEHPDCEPEKTHLVLNFGTMDAQWEKEEPAESVYVDTATALSALLHDVKLRATYNDRSVFISKLSRISDFLELAPDLLLQDIINGGEMGNTRRIEKNLHR